MNHIDGEQLPTLLIPVSLKLFAEIVNPGQGSQMFMVEWLWHGLKGIIYCNIVVRYNRKHWYYEGKEKWNLKSSTKTGAQKQLQLVGGIHPALFRSYIWQRPLAENERVRNSSTARWDVL